MAMGLACSGLAIPAAIPACVAAAMFALSPTIPPVPEPGGGIPPMDMPPP